jgi:hypothetical protein
LFWVGFSVTYGLTSRKKTLGFAQMIGNVSGLVAAEPGTVNQFGTRPLFNEFVCVCSSLVFAVAMVLAESCACNCSVPKHNTQNGIEAVNIAHII